MVIWWFGTGKLAVKIRSRPHILVYAATKAVNGKNN